MKQQSNRYLYHWLPLQRFQRFQREGFLKPYWSHFIPEAMRMVKGISTCHEPMLWVPDEGRDAEICLIIDRTSFVFDSISLDSGRTYHLTREIKLALRAGRDIAPAVERHMASASFRGAARADEEFITSAIPKSAVPAIGYSHERAGSLYLEAVDAIQLNGELACIDMTEWKIGSPGIAETDEIVTDEIERLARSHIFPLNAKCV